MLEDELMLQEMTAIVAPAVEPEEQEAAEDELSQMIEEMIYQEDLEEAKPAEILPFGDDMFDLEDDETEELEEVG